jgi:hypothetical protein
MFSLVSVTALALFSFSGKILASKLNADDKDASVEVKRPPGFDSFISASTFESLSL